MFDFASMQIQKLSYTYLEEAKIVARDMVKGHISKNELYTADKANNIF